MGAAGELPVDPHQVARLGDLGGEDELVLPEAHLQGGFISAHGAFHQGPRTTSWALLGSGRLAFRSMSSVRRAGSRLPQLAPILTGFPRSMAMRIISAKCSSLCRPRPRVPGLMRNLSRASAIFGYLRRRRCPLKWKSPTRGTSAPSARSLLLISGTAFAASSSFTVRRTISLPARWSSRTWAVVASTSRVGVLVMDCTAMGWAPPMGTRPT